MQDLCHGWGLDLVVDPKGDLAIAEGNLLGQQRVLHRLLTNRGDYIWQREYGAGLAQFVGSPASTSQISAMIRSQMTMEQAVAISPAPAISISAGEDRDLCAIFVTVQYVDASSSQLQVMQFSAGK